MVAILALRYSTERMLSDCHGLIRNMSKYIPLNGSFFGESALVRCALPYSLQVLDIGAGIGKWNPRLFKVV